MNKGIIIHGGSIAASNLAVGDGAMASGSASHAELTAKLTEMMKVIADANLSQERRAALVHAVEVIRADAPAGKSTAGTAVDFLVKAAPAITGLSSLVGAVSGIVQAMQ